MKKEMLDKLIVFFAVYSYRLGDSHDSMDCETIHLLPLDMFGEQLQHG